VNPSVWVWWVLTILVFAQSNLSVRSGFQQDSTNTDPGPLEETPHIEPGTAVPETCFPLSQMEQTSHMQLQVSEVIK